MMKVHYPSIALALLAGGCSWLPSVGPDYRRPEIELPEIALPDAFAPTTNKTSTGEFAVADAAEDRRVLVSADTIRRWWNRFDDPVLSRLVCEAVSNNISFLMAQERLTAARWQLVGSYATFLPHVDASLSGVRLEQGPNTSTMAGSGKTMHKSVFSGGFDATWEIDIFGGGRRATQAAWAEAEAAGWNIADAWVSLTAEVGAQYIELRTIQQRIEVARTNLILQAETYDILKSRLDAGIGDELAVNQSKYIVDQTHAAIPPLLAQEEKLKNALAILAGDVPGTRHGDLTAVARRSWLLEPGRIEKIPLDMIRARPDVRVAERELAAQVAYVGVAESRWYPKLYINGAIGLESTKSTKLFQRDSLYGSIGPSVSWPLFQGGNIYADIKAEEAKMNEKALNYELALHRAYGEVRDAYAAYTQEFHRRQALEGAVQAARDAVAIAKNLYQNGLKDFTAVIDAQRSLLSLQNELVVSRGQITQNAISLYKALGGGVEVQE